MSPRERRAPRQARSRATVERIVAAGRAVLLERGWDGVTTNHVAAAAGVSPGSLYQYFPDKEAVLDEVVDRETVHLEARISRAFVDTLRAPSRGDVVRRNVEALLDAFGEQPAMTRVLADQMPRGAGSRRAAFARRVDELVAAVLAGQDTGQRRPDVMAWVMVRAVEQATIGWVLEDPPVDRADLVDELTLLVTRYLERRWDREVARSTASD
ncbi:TetR/AcrR family transcriptional regulator [Actinomycetospora cinnamomea]|uniref:TetR family transcriptional regulator n=1 Tax=Actinomycetospora cinnamomea TaxID=663609 RepID=A0A2U1EAI0_9PSEU|nr:TetR/AcrR family transcriptional regulator [Actinomycetospora cinnamomea]PVY96907.1 TetR family transcriptional regulator [Actinomycetospora cinnamomea]